MPSTEVATQTTGPAAIIGQYVGDFGLVLPETFRPETFVRLAQGALRRDPGLRVAAQVNPGSLLHALLDAARLGHEPGTHDYYLTPRGLKKTRDGEWEAGPKTEVVGIEGYRGIVKRMLNHPNVLSVIAEAVYSNDVFDFIPGEHDRPSHRVDWFGERGDLLGAYAYAVLTGNATSRVVVIGPKDITEARKASDSARSDYSPWNKYPEAMYRKTALRRLEPFVAKASEAVAAQQERTVTASQVAETHDLPELPPPGVDTDTGEILEGEFVDPPDNPGFEGNQ